MWRHIKSSFSSVGITILLVIVFVIICQCFGITFGPQDAMKEYMLKNNIP